MSISSATVASYQDQIASSRSRVLNRPLIYVLFFVSGASALVYQTAWQRLLGLFSGSDTVAATIVVGAFLLGLGLGSLWGASVADRLSRRAALGAFALCEIAIALFAALSPTLFYDLLFRELIGLAGRTDLVIGVTFLSLLPPTLMMGVSLPLLARALADDADTIAVEVGLLYGLNTLGAATGTFLAGWVVIGTVGYALTVYLGVVLNLLVGLGAWLARRGLPETPAAAEGVARHARPAADDASRRVWTWSALVFASGFLIIALEIVWFRLLGVMMQGNAYAFSLVLTVFLLGDALGIVAGVALLRIVRDLRRAFFLLQGGMAIYALASILLLFQAHAAFGGFIAVEATGAYADLPILFGIAGLTMLVVLPPAFLLGMSFPLAQAAVQNDPALVGRRVGIIQLFNILGNAMGALATGLLLLHWLGTVGTLRLIGLAGALVLAVNLVAWRAGRSRWSEIALIAAAAVCLASLPGNDRFWSRLHGANDGDETFVAEDRTGVALFRPQGEHWGLYIVGHHQSQTPFGPYQVALGLIGVALHPDPKSVLIVGQGTGGTPYGAGVGPNIDTIRVIEIVEPVYDVTRALAAAHGDPGLDRYLRDPRYTRVVGDGRHALFVEDRTYDVIEADAIYPHGSRAGMLYSVEHFRQILSRLNPGGICVQWQPTLQTERTFRAAFPYVVQTSRGMLLGSNDPIPFDLPALHERIRGPMRAYLEAAGVDPEAVIADIGEPIRFQRPEDDRPRARLNTDLFPRDEYYLNSPLNF